MQLFAHGSNLGNLSFFGFLFLVMYALILGILIAFWIGFAGPFKLNLVITLWILAAVIPVFLFFMNLGLDPELCKVQGFQNVQASKSKKQN